MRILQLFDLLSPYGGGTVDLIFRLSRALAQKGHQVTIFTSDFKLDREYLASLHEVNVHPFHCFSSLAGFYLTPGLIAGARKQLKEFDVIHLHCFRSFQNMVINHYAQRYGVPYILDAHGSLPRTVGGRRGLKWLLKWLFDVTFGHRILEGASTVIAETEVGVNEYIEIGLDTGKIALITPPFAVEDFSQLPPPGLFRKNYNIKEKNIVLFLGRIHRIKGLDFLVESFYELTKLRNSVILTIAGNDDGYQPALERLVKELNLSGKVLFTGFLRGVDKLSALVDADVMVQTSHYEQGTGAPFEAILCHTPIIVTKNTSASENVKQIDAGYLVEYGNKTELRDTIHYVLDNPAEAQQKTEKAREYIRANLSLEKGVAKYEQLYADCLAAQRAN